MIKKIIFWLENARWYALPMTVLSWLTAFIYGISQDGNILYGAIALIGLIFAHLGANLIDDYIDFKKLTKAKDGDRIILPNSRRDKCTFLLNNEATLKETLCVIGLFCSIAALIGFALFLLTGSGVILYALLGAVVMFIYPFISRFGEIALFLAYGPFMFGGVYYVMTQEFAPEVFLISVPTAILTISVLYINNILDYDIDLKENKRTLANFFKTKKGALKFWTGMVAVAYLSVFMCVASDITNWQVLLTYITIPLAVNVYNSMVQFSEDEESVPEIQWYNFPFENAEKLISEKTANFKFRMYQIRNLMMYFALIFAVALMAD
ncbi:prenyltransferase [bacterium]|nr:prenyltransferase [bacterium]